MWSLMTPSRLVTAMHVSPPVQKRLRAAAGAGSTSAARTTNTTVTPNTRMVARVSSAAPGTSNPTSRSREQ